MPKLTIPSVLGAAAVALALAATPALADGTVSADGVTATVTTNQTQFTQTVSIAVAHKAPFSLTLPCDGAPCGGSLQVTRIGPGPRPDVIVRSFAEGGGGEVILDDFSWNVPRNTWLDSHLAFPLLEVPSPVLTPLGGGFSGFVTHPGLAGVGLPGYAGVGPIDILRPVAGHLVDVAGQFPAAVSADAAQWLAQYQAITPPADNVAPLAAWAADESILGDGPAALAYLNGQAGRLNLGGQPVTPAQLEQTLAVDGYPLTGA